MPNKTIFMFVVIDSTEFRRDRTLNKQDIAHLRDLGSKNLIKIHIPWFIYKESTTHAVVELETKLNKIKSILSTLDKNGISPNDFQTVKNISKQVEEFRSEVKGSNARLWKTFINESNATLHEFSKEHSAKVFDAYFSGDKPFKSLKSRPDIPDAFIYMTILDLAKKGKVYFISEDANFREKCNSEKNVYAFKDFDSFFDDTEIRKLSNKYQDLLEREKIDEAKELLLDYKYVFEDAVQRFIETVNYLELTETALPSDNGEVTVRSIDEPIVMINELDIEFHSNQFYVPIEVRATAWVDYLIYKADYWTYNDIPNYTEDWNEHYYLIEDNFPVTLKTTIIIDKKDFSEDNEPNIEIDDFDEIILDVSKDSGDTYQDDWSEPLDW